MKVEHQSDLLPCPFCGGPAFLKTDNNDFCTKQGARRQYWVKCDLLDCGATINSDLDSKAVAGRWNRRLATCEAETADKQPRHYFNKVMPR